jgi:hypothetical protein
VAQREERWDNSIALKKAPRGATYGFFSGLCRPWRGSAPPAPPLPTAFRRGPDYVGPYGPRLTRMRHLICEQEHAPKDWADSYLALANSSELTLVTFDRGFLHRYQHVIVLRKDE